MALHFPPEWLDENLPAIVERLVEGGTDLVEFMGGAGETLRAAL